MKKENNRKTKDAYLPTSEVSFDGSPEADGDNVAPFRLLGGRAEGFGGELWDCFGNQRRHFRFDPSTTWCGFRGSRPEGE